MSPPFCSIEEDFVTWKEKLWQAVQDHYGVEQSAEMFNQRLYEFVTHAPGEIAESDIFKGGISKPAIDINNQKG